MFCNELCLPMFWNSGYQLKKNNDINYFNAKRSVYRSALICMKKIVCVCNTD